MATAFRERPEFLRGRNGEQLVARWLQEQGWYVIPSYDYSGDDGDKAPRLQGLVEKYAVPDLDVSSKGQRRWVEVKTKERPVPYRKADWELRHGIDVRHLHNYRQVARETGTECWLAIFEEFHWDWTWSGSLLIQSLSRLGDPCPGGGSDGRGKRIAFWPRNSFHLACTFDKS